MKLSSLHIYPVKSMRGLNIRYASVESRGLENDRRWMLIDDKGDFITQRSNPKLAQIKVRVFDGELKLTIPNLAPLTVPAPDENERIQSRIWGNHVDAAVIGGEDTAQLSSFLGQPVSLVFMDELAKRVTEPGFVQEQTPVSFADGYPVLIANTASLDNLNTAIAEGGGTAVPMTRFRPNIVIETSEPWVEDKWQSLEIGSVVLDLVKPCTRCVMTSIDQVQGIKTGREPLASLRKLRTSTYPGVEGVLFGWNAIVRTPGRIGTRDDVKVTRRT